MRFLAAGLIRRRVDDLPLPAAILRPLSETPAPFSEVMARSMRFLSCYSSLTILSMSKSTPPQRITDLNLIGTNTRRNQLEMLRLSSKSLSIASTIGAFRIPIPRVLDGHAKKAEAGQRDFSRPARYVVQAIPRKLACRVSAEFRPVVISGCYTSERRLGRLNQRLLYSNRENPVRPERFIRYLHRIEKSLCDCGTIRVGLSSIGIRLLMGSPAKIVRTKKLELPNCSPIASHASFIILTFSLTAIPAPRRY